MRDVFEGISQDSIFADIEPPVYLVTQNARERLPRLDISTIPHCSSLSDAELASHAIPTLKLAPSTAPQCSSLDDAEVTPQLLSKVTTLRLAPSAEPHCSGLSNAEVATTALGAIAKVKLEPPTQYANPLSQPNSDVESPSNSPDNTPPLASTHSANVACAEPIPIAEGTVNTANKGRGKGKAKVRASETLEANTKYHGVNTRLRAKREKEARANAKSGMEKLLSTSRDMVEDPEAIDLTDSDQPTQPIVGDFSAHDLIRSRIAEPQNFDEPAPAPSLPNEIAVVTHDARAGTSSVNSRWSFNPLSYFQRTDSANSTCDVANNNGSRNDSQEIDEVQASISAPQCASTPQE